MFKTLHVAWREFVTTALTRGFIIGVFLPPIIMTFAFMLMPRLMNQKPPTTEGRIAVIDQSGLVAERLKTELSPERLEERRRRRAEAIKEEAQKVAPMAASNPAMNQMQEQMLLGADGPKLTLETLPGDTPVDQAKAEVPTARSREKLQGTNPRLALIVVPQGAVVPPDSGEKKGVFERFELFSTPTLDAEVSSMISDAVQRSIVDARLTAGGFDTARIRSLITTPRGETLTVTDTGERRTNRAAQMLIPGAFLFLTWIAVFTAGQSLLTTTIEEKGNRIMEVLLSAVSPMQLMTGKIIGQMGVGLLILGLYASAGVVALFAMAMSDLINPMHIVYMLVYFFIAFALIACMMAAIGSAVSDLREAQSLMGPMMIVLVIPMILWFPILRNPNSMFATVCSFIPPISPFIMVLRIAGSEPVPFWQIPATIVLGLVAVYIFAWAAAKIFRIGVLMYGKPPNFSTLLKWIRMA